MSPFRLTINTQTLVYLDKEKEWWMVETDPVWIHKISTAEAFRWIKEHYYAGILPQ